MENLIMNSDAAIQDAIMAVRTFPGEQICLEPACRATVPGRSNVERLASGSRVSNLTLLLFRTPRVPLHVYACVRCTPTSVAIQLRWADPPLGFFRVDTMGSVGYALHPWHRFYPHAMTDKAGFY